MVTDPNTSLPGSSSVSKKDRPGKIVTTTPGSIPGSINPSVVSSKVKAGLGIALGLGLVTAAIFAFKNK